MRTPLLRVLGPVKITIPVKTGKGQPEGLQLRSGPDQQRLDVAFGAVGGEDYNFVANY